MRKKTLNFKNREETLAYSKMFSLTNNSPTPTQTEKEAYEREYAIYYGINGLCTYNEGEVRFDLEIFK
jgi:hypothetical protein